MTSIKLEAHTCLESCTCAAKAPVVTAIEDKSQTSLGHFIREDLRAQGIENPLLMNNGPIMKESEKIKKIEGSFKEILETMGIDLKDPSVEKTPHRVAKMYVKELCSGLNADNFPACTTFPVTQNSVVFQRDIPFTSMCEHHFLLFSGVAHVGYYSNGKVIGLSKLNRIVEYFARRPQI
jgi:GTP cyclohydrolase I